MGLVQPVENYLKLPVYGEELCAVCRRGYIAFQMRCTAKSRILKEINLLCVLFLLIAEWGWYFISDLYTTRNNESHLK